MEDRPLFSIWTVYPLESWPFFLIALSTVFFLCVLYFGYHKLSKRLLIADALVLVLTYTMWVWNVVQNTNDDHGWSTFIAYLVYVITAQGLISWGVEKKWPELKWGGWFFLILTAVHFLFVNMWYVDTQFKSMIGILLAFALFYNKHHFPRD